MQRMSTGLCNELLVGSDLKTIFDGGFIKFYEGVPPAHADDAENTLLCTLTESDDGTTGLTFDAAAADGVLQKNPAETWAGTHVATGDVTHYRLVQPADTGAASTTEIRVQGTCGVVGTDILVADDHFVTAVLFTLLNFYQAWRPG